MQLVVELHTARSEKLLEMNVEQSYGELTCMDIDLPEEKTNCAHNGLSVENNDNRVLQCSLQYQSLYPNLTIILCTCVPLINCVSLPEMTSTETICNDKNLCSKALLSGVKAVSKESERNRNNSEAERREAAASALGPEVASLVSILEECLEKVLSAVLEKEIKIAFDDLWMESNCKTQERSPLEAGSGTALPRGRVSPLPSDDETLMSDEQNSLEPRPSHWEVWAIFDNIWSTMCQYSTAVFATFNYPYAPGTVLLDGKLPSPDEAYACLQKLLAAVKELLVCFQSSKFYP
ncbi:Transcriptional protein SWT1 [Acipenser ruthenus]|uniref:Transcriptional protein SWT1 n=1 Tax=Acipenser ruthenus TaxID=7906 RepID=A0A444UC85_ACIRT|nr:Transcriptional protein SWT1 [Acipenser ruthenus]